MLSRVTCVRARARERASTPHLIRSADDLQQCAGRSWHSREQFYRLLGLPALGGIDRIHVHQHHDVLLWVHGACSFLASAAPLFLPILGLIEARPRTVRCTAHAVGIRTLAITRGCTRPSAKSRKDSNHWWSE